MTAHSLDLTRSGMIAALSFAEPTAEDFVIWVRERDDKPMSQIRWVFTDLQIDGDWSLPVLERYLLRRQQAERRKVERGHWAAQPFRAPQIDRLLKLIKEFNERGAA